MTQPDRNSQRAPWLAVALLAVLAGACVTLGFWQLERAAETRALAERFAAVEALAPTPQPFEELDEIAADALRYRVVESAGRYEPSRQFLIDNIVRDGVPGYLVLTPFRPDDREPWLIVNRGWIRADPDRSALPDIAVPEEPRRVTGRLDTLPAPGLRLGGENTAGPAADGIEVLSYPTMLELESALGRDLFDYQLLLHPEQPDGFARYWRGPALDPSRNLAYAGQWWLFAAVAGVAAVGIAWRRLQRSDR